MPIIIYTQNIFNMDHFELMKEISTQKLRSLIGTHVNWQNQEHVIVEVLEDELALVLRSTQQSKIIQPDQHGEAHRRVQNTVTLTIYSNTEKSELNPEFMELGLQLD